MRSIIGFGRTGQLPMLARTDSFRCYINYYFVSTYRSGPRQGTCRCELYEAGRERTGNRA